MDLCQVSLHNYKSNKRTIGYVWWLFSVFVLKNWYLYHFQILDSNMVFYLFFIFFLVFGDCFQLMVFIYNCHLFHSLHMTFTPLNRESHDNTKRVSTTEPPRESYEEPPLRATQGSRELLPVGRRETQRHRVASLPFLLFLLLLVPFLCLCCRDRSQCKNLSLFL